MNVRNELHNTDPLMQQLPEKNFKATLRQSEGLGKVCRSLICPPTEANC